MWSLNRAALLHRSLLKRVAIQIQLPATVACLTPRSWHIQSCFHHHHAFSKTICRIWYLCYWHFKMVLGAHLNNTWLYAESSVSKENTRWLVPFYSLKKLLDLQAGSHNMLFSQEALLDLLSLGVSHKAVDDKCCNTAHAALRSLGKLTWVQNKHLGIRIVMCIDLIFRLDCICLSDGSLLFSPCYALFFTQIIMIHCRSRMYNAKKANIFCRKNQKRKKFASSSVVNCVSVLVWLIQPLVIARDSPVCWLRWIGWVHST